MHILFSTIYLFVGTEIKSQQIIWAENKWDFIKSTEYDAHMHAKFEDLILSRFL
jgi:hypothetical protein